MTALLLWLTCPVVYTVAVGRHYARRCHDELTAVRACRDDLHDLHDLHDRYDLRDSYDPVPPTTPIPLPTGGRHRRSPEPTQRTRPPCLPPRPGAG